ncbi:uncharacterized protein FIBRA_04014 [Fibroporia radiculosa]|uniref:Uncharacterized protein n=1 Tax=Fibroporia radiculosa TaxID=599839 RepID=J4I9X9_9APHY|nr:uncharacterized protein FIBRA_04014 [Fibroporia radiculosa]CCM01941.1 predicted protein [Fibroporia radiculosa]
MYLLDSSLPRRDDFCPPGHSGCGPGPVIGITVNPPQPSPQASLAQSPYPASSARSLIVMTVIGSVLFLVGLIIWFFGRRLQQKEKERKARREHNTYTTTMDPEKKEEEVVCREQGLLEAVEPEPEVEVEK